MAIRLLFPYSTDVAGATVDYDNATEAALVAQGRAVYTSNPGAAFQPLTAQEQQAYRDSQPALSALVGGDRNITRAALIALAEANALVPGAIYQTTDGVMCYALTARYLQPMSGMWYQDARPVSVGNTLTTIDAQYCMLPPLAPGASVEVRPRAYLDKSTASRRLEVYLSGALGNTAGATTLYNRSTTSNTIGAVAPVVNFSNRNDAGAQINNNTGDATPYGETGNYPAVLAVNTDVSQLIRARITGSKQTGAEIITVTSAVRTSNVVTVTESVAHGLSTGDFIQITGATPSDMNVDGVAITVTSTTTYTYPATGANGSGTGTIQRTKYNAVRCESFAVFVRQQLNAA